MVARLKQSLPRHAARLVVRAFASRALGVEEVFATWRIVVINTVVLILSGDSIRNEFGFSFQYI
jgi:hypothetical protein